MTVLCLQFCQPLLNSCPFVSHSALNKHHWVIEQLFGDGAAQIIHRLWVTWALLRLLAASLCLLYASEHPAVKAQHDHGPASGGALLAAVGCQGQLRRALITCQTCLTCIVQWLPDTGSGMLPLWCITDACDSDIVMRTDSMCQMHEVVRPCRVPSPSPAGSASSTQLLRVLIFRHYPANPSRLSMQGKPLQGRSQLLTHLGTAAAGAARE